MRISQKRYTSTRKLPRGPDITKKILYYTSFLDCPETQDFVDVRCSQDTLRTFTFIADNLLHQIEATARLPVAARESALRKCIDLYAPIARWYPTCPELLPLYSALTEMYKRLAQTVLSNRPGVPLHLLAREVIQYYKRCLPLLNIYYKHDLIPDGRMTIVPILLAFWHLDMRRYQQALYYAQEYLKYDPAGAVAYHDLKMIIARQQALEKNSDTRKIEQHEEK